MVALQSDKYVASYSTYQILSEKFIHYLFLSFLFFHENISIIRSKNLIFAPMVPQNLGLIEMALMIFLFTFSMNLKKDTMLVEYVHSPKKLIK